VAATKPIYRVHFHADNKAYELHARELDTTAVFGFVAVGKFVWGSRSEVIVDPSEQSLKNEFDGVKKTYIPYHAVQRIDVVERAGGGKVVSLPGSGKAASTGPAVFPPGMPDPGSSKT
jgi:hypothetical protein